MTTSELAMVDTNVLVYAADQTSPFHEPSRQLRDQGMTGAVALALSPQVLLEFFAVITNPKRVLQPRSPKEAREEIEKYLQARQIRKIYPGPDILDRILALLQTYEVRRQEVFDVYLAATMLTNNVTRIYTYNREHFEKFTELAVFTP